MLILHFLLVFNRNASNNDFVYLVMRVEAKEFTLFPTLCKITQNNGQNSPQSVIMDGRQAHEPNGVADCLTTTKPLHSEHNLKLKTERFQSHRSSKTRMKTWICDIAHHLPRITPRTYSVLDTQRQLRTCRGKWVKWKVLGFERHLLKRSRWYFAFFKRGGRSAVNQ
jgi:hypothetical protein